MVSSDDPKNSRFPPTLSQNKSCHNRHIYIQTHVVKAKVYFYCLIFFFLYTKSINQSAANPTLREQMFTIKACYKIYMLNRIMMHSVSCFTWRMILLSSPLCTLTTHAFLHTLTIDCYHMFIFSLLIWTLILSHRS